MDVRDARPADVGAVAVAPAGDADADDSGLALVRAGGGERAQDQDGGQVGREQTTVMTHEHSLFLPGSGQALSAWRPVTKRLAGRASPRFSRRVLPSYSVRNR